MNNASIFAVCDDGIVFYGGSQNTGISGLRMCVLDTEIRGVYHTEKNYVGVVFIMPREAQDTAYGDL